MTTIPLEPLAHGNGDEHYIFNLIIEKGVGFCELKVADSNGDPLAPRLRIENVNGSLRLFVWDVTAQDTPGTHLPPYSHQAELTYAGQPSISRNLIDTLLAHSPPTPT